MLTILAAMNDELRLIKSEMEIDKTIFLRPFTIFIGRYHGIDLTLIRTGIGKDAMYAAVSYCIQNLKPTFLMNIGYAGGLDPRLAAGDIIIANSIVDEADGKIITADSSIVGGAVSKAEAANIHYCVGRIVTVKNAITEPHDKAYIGAKFEAAACDMESATFAAVAASNNIQYVVARAILDTMDTALPALSKTVTADGGITIGKIVGHIKTNPTDALKLPKFSYLCSQARISMTNFVREWIRYDHGV